MKAVLSNGVTYAGIRDLTPNPTPFLWYDLTDTGNTYPANACSVSIASQANDVSIEVLTTTGQVWETTCDVVNGATDELDCTEVWTQQTTPTPGDDG